MLRRSQANAQKHRLTFRWNRNSAAKAHRTNVWCLYRTLDLTQGDQIALYDDGVGSQEFLPFRILGGVFGWGLKRNVLDLYAFLCQNYEEGDRIYIFGLSRGAFTARVLAGLICHQGLRQGLSPEELKKGIVNLLDILIHHSIWPSRA